MSFYLQSFVELVRGGGGGGGEISIIVGRSSLYLADFTVIFNSYSFSVNSYISFLFISFHFFSFLSFFPSHLNDRWTANGVFF